MIQFKVSKTAFKNALEISKRTLAKNNNTGLFLISNSKDLLILTPGDSILVYDYLSLPEQCEPFAFTIQPAPILTGLDGSDRELLFEIDEKEDGTKVLKNCEKNVEFPIIKSGNPSTAFKDMRNMNFVGFDNPTNFIESVNRVVTTHQNSEEKYSELVELKDKSIHSYSPLIYAEYRFGEELGIKETFNVDGIGIDKKALDIFTKSVKTSKNISYFFSENPTKLFLKDNNKVFALGIYLSGSDLIESSNDTLFPVVDFKSAGSSFNILEDSRKTFHINATEMNAALLHFKNDKVGKITLETIDGELTIISGLADFPDKSIKFDFNLERPCSFQLPALKSFFKDLKGEISLSLVNFVSNSMKDKSQIGYALEYSTFINQELGLIKIMPGIKSSEGY